jgi:hypothetical protein
MAPPPLDRLRNGTPEEKCAAAAELGRLRPTDPAAIDALGAALGEDGYYDRQRAARAVRPSPMFGPEYVSVASAAADALALIGADAVPALERALSSSRRVAVPDPAYDQTVYIGDWGAVVVFSAELAARALQRIGGPALVSLPALQALLDRPEPQVRKAGREAILTLAAYERQPNAAVAALLVRCVRGTWSEDSGALKKVAAAGPNAAPALRQAFSEIDGLAQDTATRYLEEHPHEGGREERSELEGRYRQNRREQVVEAIAKVGPDARELLPLLVRALEDGQGPHPLLIAEALIALGGELDRAENVARASRHGVATIRDPAVRSWVERRADALLDRIARMRRA